MIGRTGAGAIILLRERCLDPGVHVNIEITFCQNPILANVLTVIFPKMLNFISQGKCTHRAIYYYIYCIYVYRYTRVRHNRCYVGTGSSSRRRIA